MNLGDTKNRALRPCAQGFDEIRITTVPRYKQSELSGDEWRISAKIEFLLKGIVRHTVDTSNVRNACSHLGYHHDHATDSGFGYYGGLENFCDQEGCKNEATNKMFLKKEYDKNGKGSEFSFPTYRMFCDKHKIRGDASFEDSDGNYQ